MGSGIEMKSLLKHGITRCSYSMLRISCIEMTWLLIHMKYNRYTSHFIGLVHINLVVISTWQLLPMHICMLQVGRWCWYTNFAYFSCCIDTDCLRLDLVSSRFCRANLSCYTCPHIYLVVVLILIICLLNSEGLEPGPTYLSWSNMFFLQQPSL